MFFPAYVSLASGKALQLASASRRIDHQPVIRKYLISGLANYAGNERWFSWDYDALVSCIMSGDKRQVFFDHLRNEIMKHEHLMNHVKGNDLLSPTGVYDVIINMC